MISIERIISKLDEYFAKNDPSGGESLLDYWLAEAEMCGDIKSMITLLSEQAGLCRMLGKREKALGCSGKVLALLDECSLSDTVSGGTILINAATVFAAFGKAEESLPVFEKARTVFNAYLTEDDELFGSLYNNYASALADLGRFDESLDMYGKALDIMGKVSGGKCEQAVTLLNMAGVVRKRDGLWEGSEEIERYAEKAEALLTDTALDHDVHYTQTCSKCIPVFRYYGYFAIADELEKQVNEIYAGN